MRSGIALLAGLAGSAFALPTASNNELDARTFGLVGNLLGDVVDTVNDILHGTSPVDLLGGISAGAAAALQGGALGCTAGSVDLEYRKKLAVWLNAGHGLHLEASVKKALLAWCEADASVDLDIDVDIRAQLGFFIPACANVAAEANLFVSLDGVSTLAAEALGVLSATAQASLKAAIGLLGELDWKVAAALDFIASGGVVGDLDIEVLNALKVWIGSSDCGLHVGLKATINLWLAGKIGGDIIQIDSLPVGGLATISVGKSLHALIGGEGALLAGAQVSLNAFLQTDIGAELDVDIKGLLENIVKGALAVDIDLDTRIKLSVWLGSGDCSLTAELKGLLALWLSFGVGANLDLSIGLGLDLDSGVIGDLTSFLTGTIDSLLGTHLHGLLSFILGGQGVLSLSIEARAQLAALIGGGVGIEIPDHILTILIGWLTGCQKCCGGHVIHHTSVTPSVTPSKTPALPATQTPSVPSGTPAVPTDVSPTETPAETPASPSETPCDTLTSESVTSELVTETPSAPVSTPAGPTDVSPSETPEVPAGTPSGPAETPAVPEVTETPSGPAETSTPCETLTSESVTSEIVSETPSAPAETPAVPEVTETPSAPAETSTPCETLTSESVTSEIISETPSAPAETPEFPAGTPSGPAETPAGPTDVSPTETPAETPAVPATETPAAPAETSTPCETLTSDVVSSSVISETPAGPTDVSPTETPAPSNMPAPSGSSCAGCGLQTITVTKTVSIAACPTA